MLIREFPDAPADEQTASIVMDAAGRLASPKQVDLCVDYDNKLGWLDPNKADCQNVMPQQTRFAEDLVKRLDAWLTNIWPAPF